MTDPFATKSSSQKKKKNTINSFEVFKPQSSENTVDSLEMFKLHPSKNTVDSLDLFKPKDLLKAAGEQAKPQGNWAKDWLGLSNESHQQGGQPIQMEQGKAYSLQAQQEAQKQQEQAERPIEAAMDYSREILHVGENSNGQEAQESSQKIQMLIQELQRLAQSVEQIEKTLILQAIDPSAGKKTGKYYESFFEWMLLVVQDARRKVEDSGAWLSAMSGKKGKGIHKMMKSNMQVAMSGERTQANNAG